MKIKAIKDNFRIEGWFPPGIINTISGKYACCGTNWVEIEADVTTEDVMKGWICKAPIYITKNEKPKINKSIKKIKILK